MPNLRSTSKVSLLLGALVFLSPANAQDILVKSRSTFRDFEYQLDGAERISAARASLGVNIPAGTATATARTVVRQEGAHCGAAVDDGITRCTFSSFEAIDDHLHDVVWTIGLNSAGGKVVDLSVDRQSIES